MNNMLYATVAEGIQSFVFSFLIVMPVQGVLYAIGFIDDYHIEPVMYVCAMFAFFDVCVLLYQTQVEYLDEEE